MDKTQIKKALEKLHDELKAMRVEKSTAPGSGGNWLDHTRGEMKDGHKMGEISKTMKSRKALRGHFGKIYAMHWAQDDEHKNQLVSASQDGKLIIWNGLTTHKLNAIMLRSSWVMTCAFSPSSKYIACGGLDNLCSIYKVDDAKDPDSKMELVELGGHDGYLSCCRFIDDERIVTTSGDGTCIVWNIAGMSSHEQKQLMVLKDHTADVMSVSVCKKEGIIVTGSCDTTAKVWDIRQKRPCVMDFADLHNSDINSVAFFPDGKAFGTGTDNSKARLLDLRSCAKLAEFSNGPQSMSCVTSVDFSKTGKVLFCGHDDYVVQVWNVATSRNLTTLVQHDHRVSCLGVSSDGKALCTGSWDTYLRIWA